MIPPRSVEFNELNYSKEHHQGGNPRESRSRNEPQKTKFQSKRDFAGHVKKERKLATRPSGNFIERATNRLGKNKKPK